MFQLKEKVSFGSRGLKVEEHDIKRENAGEKQWTGTRWPRRGLSRGRHASAEEMTHKYEPLSQGEKARPSGGGI